ncbi:MAG: glycosyltransferase [Desulfomonile sp.]|nr:glycosyltransferase [Desulfomonile sp.]
MGNYLQRVVGLLASRGHDCEVFVSNLERAVDEPDDVLNVRGVTIHLLNEFTDIPPELKDLSLWPIQRAKLWGAWRLAQALERSHTSQPFDVVHAGNCGHVSLFVDIPVPVVMRLSSYEPMLADAHKMEQSLWRTTTEYLERATLWTSDALYAPSRMLSDAMQAALALPVSYIPPPAYLEVPPESYDTAWWTEATALSSPYFVFVGSLARVKGLETLLEALPILFEACPDPHFHFVGREWGGFDFWEECRSRFQGRVHYHGPQSHHRVYPLIQNSIAAVIPSRIENASNVAIEAMLLGKPIVGTQGISLEELIDGKPCAILIPKDDPVALAYAMIDLANMPADQRDFMGKQGQQAIASVLNVERSGNLLEGFLDEAVRKGPRRRSSAQQRMLDLKATLEAFFSIELSIQEKIAAQSSIAAQLTFQRDAAHSRLEQLKAEAQNQHTRIEQLNDLMDVRQARIEQLRAEVEHQHTRIEQLNTLMEARQKRIEQLKSAVDAKHKQVEQARKQLETGRQRIADLKAQVGVKLGQVQELIAQRKADRAKIEDYETRLNERQTQIRGLTAQLDDRQQEIAVLSTSLQAAGKRIEELEQEIETLRNSISYRMGNFLVRCVPEPIRRFLSCVNRF